MQLVTIGSGSTGNAYALITKDEILLIEAGINWKEVQKAIDYRVSDIVGCIVSHEHSDHIGYGNDYAKHGVKIYGPAEICKKIQNTYDKPMEIEPNKAYNIGKFTIQAFNLVHNVKCYGYYIKHDELGKLLFITDTMYVPQNFSKLSINHILCESNYSKEIVDKYSVNSGHIFNGHMEINTTCQFLQNNSTEALKNVILLHLSDKNSNETDFIEKARKSVQGNVNVYCADKGLKVDLGIMPDWCN